MAKPRRKPKAGSAKGEPRPVGRPTDYRDEFPKQAHKYCLLGATNEDLAKLFEVATSTIGKWIAEIPAFSDAVKAGRAEADAKVSTSLFHRATGYSHAAVKIFQYEGAPVEVPYTEHYPPDATSMIFWLKNRRPDLWRDKTEHEHSGSVNLLETLEAARARAANARRK